MFSDQTIPDSPINLFKKLKSLILIHTGINWKTLFKVLPAFPILQSLVLCRNNMSDTDNIVLQENTLSTLKFLNLEDTNLEDFEGLKKLKDLKSLERLILNRNKLSRFGNIDGFKSLKALSIQHGAIEIPVAIAELAKIDSIEYFNIRHNPIGNKLGNGYVRQRSVA